MVWLIALIAAGIGGGVAALLVRRCARQIRELRVDVDRLMQYRTEFASLSSRSIDESPEATINRLRRRLNNTARIRREQFRATRYTETSINVNK